MPQVEHIIDAINVFDIKAVVVVPAGWPSFIVSEPIAAVLEAVIPAYHLGTHHVERVVMTEMGTVTVVRNAAIMGAVVATVGSNRPLRLLGALRLSLALRLLGALRLSLALRLLCALRLLLLLRLVLRRLCFSSALLLLSFLSECRKGGSEK